MNYLENLLASLDESVRDTLGGGPIGIMFSGGIDSCIIAQLARRHSEVHLYTVGLDGAHDLRMARSTAERLHLNWTPIPITSNDVREGVGSLDRMLGGSDPLTISFELPLYFVARIANEAVLTSGQGADELFGGYARYEAMPPEERRVAMRGDVEGLLSRGSPMEKRIALHFGKEIRHPFLAPKVVEAALVLPDELVIAGGQRKVALRSLAPSLDLLQESSRAKKAAQYGSGIMRCMKAEAKKDGLDLKAWVVAMAEVK